MKARRCAYVFSRLRQRLLHHPFFGRRQRNVFSKMSHLDAYTAPASASPLFSTKGDETPAKNHHILMSAVTFSTKSLWMQYFPKKLSLRSSRGKYSSPVRKPHSSFPNGLCNLHLTISVSLGAIRSTKIPTGPTGKIGPPQKVDPFFRNFSGWPRANRSTEFWTEISGNFGWMDCAHCDLPTAVLRRE